MRARSPTVLLFAALAAAPATGGAAVPEVNRQGEAGLVELPRAALLGAGSLALSAWLDYFYAAGVHGYRAAPLSVGLGLPYSLDAAVRMSAVDLDDPARRGGSVQLGLGAKRLLLDQERKRPLSVAVSLRLDSLFSRPDITPAVIVERAFGRKTVLAASAGYRIATDSVLPSIAHYGAGVERRAGRKLFLSLEAIGRSSTAGQHGASFLGALRWNIVGDLSLVVGGAAGVGSDAGARALIGLAFRPARSGAEDSDGDGVPDSFDLCPDEPEDMDGFEDGDGCPEPGGPPPGGGDRHRGPVLMRMRIPEQPVPTWIMERRVPAPPREPDDQAPATRPARPASAPAGAPIKLRLPRWVLE
jgi:hypothetical protein